MTPSREQKSSQAKTPKQEVKKHQYHSLKTMLLKDTLFSDEVGAYAWIDNAQVTAPSTVREPGPEVAKTRKRPGIKSTNAKRARVASAMQRGKRCRFYSILMIIINTWVRLT